MKKIGIMTWFSHDNYGSVLQAFALYNMLKSFNNDVKFINYRPKVRKKNIFDLSINYYNKQFFNKLSIKKYSKEFERIHTLFEKFRCNSFKYSEFCEGYTDLKNTCNTFDKIICGSDQIWSPNAYDENYFLPFVSSDKKIAYAPSIGVSNINNIGLLNKIKTLIKDFKYLSFREEKAKDILNFPNAKVVVDPTLLFNSNEWNNLLGLQQQKDDSNYILCYFLANNSNYNKLAKKLSKLTNCKIKYIPVNKNTLSNNENIVWNCGPIEFVKSISDASYVLTDSYHGMIFSIIYNKQFYILERFNNNSNESQNSRIYNLLNKYDLKNRLISNIKNINIDNSIDYRSVNKKIEVERESSISFLKNSINTACSEKKDINISSIKCTGCGMCAAVCPKKCINIELNDNGFFIPKIDNSKCINCGLCKKICGQSYNNALDLKDKKLYYTKSKEIEVIKKSTSGGAAFEISKWALENDIPVIGCRYNYEKNIAEHILIDRIEDLELLSGSKYLQSYTTNAFKMIKKLKTGIIFGTPCQISSIDRYLSILGKRNDFVLIDLICHGVPTYNLWKKTIKNEKIYNVNFRSKIKGWHNILLTINGKKINNKHFYNFFNYNLVYNECCYNCNYRAKSSSDIRLGDYWNERYNKEKYGINMLITVTDKGNELIKKINNLIIDEKSIDDYYLMQQSENELIPIDYYSLMNDLKKSSKNWNYLYKTYCKKRIYDRNIRKYGYKLIKKIKNNK